MKRIILVGCLILSAMSLLSGCGDNSSAPQPVVLIVTDRQLTLNIDTPNILKTGVWTYNVSGIAASNDGVELSVPIVSSGVLGLVADAASKPAARISVLPDSATGKYDATLNYQSAPSGNYLVKVYSIGNAPAFKSYSTSVIFNVK